MKSVLQLGSLTKSYRLGSRFGSSAIPVLRGVDLAVNAGEIVGLLGPNGAGKSTLLLCMAGLLQPDAGTVCWFGQPLARNAVPSGVAYSPEQSAYYPFLTVRETLDYYGSLHDLPISERRSRVGEVIEQVQLEPHVNKRVKQLSRGMIQRLGIAQALVGSPRALLLDETLSGLDPVANRDMRLLLGTLSSAGIAIVLSSHDMAALEIVATRIVILAGGRVTSDFSAAELTSRGLLEQRFFEALDARGASGAGAGAGAGGGLMSSALANVSAAPIPARFRASRILLIAVAGHLVAATIILARIIPQMSVLVAESPVPGHTAAMQTGIVRLMYTVVLLPPMVPLAVALLIWYGVRERARTSDFRLWMALAFAPFVAEELGRAAVVLASTDATVPGDLITQATTFTAGPAVIFDLFGVTLGASAAYWAGALSFTAAVGVYCWARAIAAAQAYSASPAVLRRQRRSTGLDFGLAVATAATVYVLAAAINFLSVPLIVPVFFSMFG